MLCSSSENRVAPPEHAESPTSLFYDIRRGGLSTWGSSWACRGGTHALSGRGRLGWGLTLGHVRWQGERDDPAHGPSPCSVSLPTTSVCNRVRWISIADPPLAWLICIEGSKAHVVAMGRWVGPPLGLPAQWESMLRNLQLGSQTSTSLLGGKGLACATWKKRARGLMVDWCRMSQSRKLSVPRGMIERQGRGIARVPLGVWSACARSVGLSGSLNRGWDGGPCRKRADERGSRSLFSWEERRRRQGKDEAKTDRDANKDGIASVVCRNERSR